MCTCINLSLLFVCLFQLSIVVLLDSWSKPWWGPQQRFWVSLLGFPGTGGQDASRAGQWSSSGVAVSGRCTCGHSGGARLLPLACCLPGVSHDYHVKFSQVSITLYNVIVLISSVFLSFFRDIFILRLFGQSLLSLSLSYPSFILNVIINDNNYLRNVSQSYRMLRKWLQYLISL